MAIKKWVQSKEVILLNYLNDGYILIGEWMRERENVFYEDLSSPFIAFDVYDKRHDLFLCTERLEQLCAIAAIPMAPMLTTGVYCLEDVVAMANRKSIFGSEQSEGVYIRFEDEYRILRRAQYIEERGESEHKNKWNIVRSDSDA